MKMTRHPNILMFQDGIENEKLVQIVTERVQPLSSYLNESKDSEAQKLNEISWGLHQIAVSRCCSFSLFDNKVEIDNFTFLKQIFSELFYRHNISFQN